MKGLKYIRNLLHSLLQKPAAIALLLIMQVIILPRAAREVPIAAIACAQK